MKINKNLIPFRYKLLLSALVFILIFLISLIFGAAETSLKDIWYAIASNLSEEKLLIIREIRLPRIIGAALLGIALGISGTIMQGLTRNPLADPGLLGLTAGANMALSITLAFFTGANYFYVMIACFIGSALGAAFVFGISSISKGGFTSIRIVLAGVAISAFLNAVSEAIGIYFRISKNISLWSSGGLIGINWAQLELVFPFILIGVIVALLFSKQLTVLSLSEEIATGLGQNIVTVKVTFFIVIIILTGVSVALAGNIAFIGLMIPHIARGIVGNEYKYVLPISMFSGATLMLIADSLGRTINAPYETPVSAILSILGLPFFLFIVHRGRGKVL